LSLVPLTTGWMAENRFATWPTVVYGSVLLLAAIAYFPAADLCDPQARSRLAAGQSHWRRLEGKISVRVVCDGIALAFVATGLAVAIYALVALIWLIPDRRIEKLVAARPES